MGSAVGLFAFYGKLKHIVDYKHLREANLVRSEIGIKGDTEAYQQKQFLIISCDWTEHYPAGADDRATDSQEAKSGEKVFISLGVGVNTFFASFLTHSNS